MTNRITALIQSLRHQRANQLFFGVGRQLALLNAFVVTLILLLVGVGTWLYSQEQLDRALTQEMEERAQIAAADWVSELATGYVPDDTGFLLPRPADDRDHDEDDLADDDVAENRSEDFFATGDTALFAFDPAGTIVAGPEWLVLANLPLRSGVDIALTGRTHQEDVSISGTLDVRTVTIPVQAQGNPIGAIQVIHSLEAQNNNAAVLAHATLAAMIAGLLVAVPAGFFLANRALTPIQHAFAQQRAFVADASHELRTPLAVVRANVELLQRLPDPSPQEIQAETEATLCEIDSMARLVDDLLFLARGDASELRSTLHQEPINLSDTVAATAEAMRPLATKSNLELTVTTEPGIMVVIHPDHAARLVRILLSNAIAYTPSPGRVRVHVAGGRSDATLRVEDTGVGISSDDLEHVFDRFYRGSSSSRQRPPSHSQPEFSGTGLGLPIAKALCSAYGGEIAIESTVGQGTTVTVSLPRVRSLLTEQHPRGISSLPQSAPTSAIRNTPNR